MKWRSKDGFKKLAIVIALCLVCAILLVISLHLIVKLSPRHQAAMERYDMLRQAYDLPVAGENGAISDAYDVEPMEIGLEDVIALNGDCVGWVEIPGTPVSYPVLRGQNNEMYTSIGYDGEPGTAIFMDCMNSVDFTSRHTVLYGRGMEDGSLFGSLHKLLAEDLLRSHQTIVITTAERQYIYSILKVRDNVAASDDAYRTTFSGDDDFTRFAADCGASWGAKRVLTLAAYNEDGMGVLVHAVWVE